MHTLEIHVVIHTRKKTLETAVPDLHKNVRVWLTRLCVHMCSIFDVIVHKKFVMEVMMMIVFG